ncbi:hypothetical protein [Prevotella dentalis]|uniref:hypothetical protein n=1 Tax=Prevotella dentalis TaxID=52227 RepID=UPI0012DEC663|nr:hypothetical protein [Prevotella dentalis]
MKIWDVTYVDFPLVQQRKTAKTQAEKRENARRKTARRDAVAPFSRDDCGLIARRLQRRARSMRSPRPCRKAAKKRNYWYSDGFMPNLSLKHLAK